MRVVLYPLRSTPGGPKAGEFPVGTVELTPGQGVVLECPDRETSQRLNDLFFKPLAVRVPRDSGRAVVAHAWRELEPGTAEHFREAAYRLRSIGVIGRRA